MALVDLRQRTGFLFLAVVLGHVLLISAQVNSRNGMPLLEAVVFGVFAEVQRGSSAVVTSARHGWGHYVDLRHTEADNDALRQRLAAAELALQEQRALAGRTRSLEALLGMRDHLDLQTAAAEIIGAAPNPEFMTLTIDKGTRDGLRADMAVLAPAGVVGRVVLPSARAAKVQLLIDRNAAAGVLIERSRAQGVAIGEGDHLRMDYVSEASDVAVGDAVVTSGIDGIFPKGFAVGRIETVEKNGPAYKRITVKTAVDFSAIEDVLVVLTPPPAREPGHEGSE
jgi:rod shape-determining protein MreC